MQQRQLFFDLDRTLWDFETNSKKTLQFLFEKENLKRYFTHFDQFNYHYRRINASLWEKYGKRKISKETLRNDRFSLTLAQVEVFDSELSISLSNDYIHFSPRQTSLFPNTIETLSYLKKEGFRMHICTNGFKEVQHIKLENSGLATYFDMVLCSEEVGSSKPSSSFFKEAMTQTACKPSDAIMIGDDFKADIHGAINAGWSAIHFDPESKYKLSHQITRIRNIDELPYTIALMK